MIKILSICLLFFVTDFYDLPYATIDGAQTSMASLRGKKILIVNIATSSSLVRQLESLEKLQKQFADKLTIVAMPSNSFNHEPKSNREIELFCRNTYHISFLLAEKASVKGEGLSPVYTWLADKNKNGVMSGEVIGDFQKYLIDEKGKLVGAFAPTIDPLDVSIQNAIITQD
jgi:glutathione peroxidase